MDHHVFDTLPIIAALLIGAKLAGRISQSFGMPSVFGELLLGLVLGPSLLNAVQPSEILALLAELGVILLMFRAGMETDVAQMRRVGRTALIVAIGGVVLPFGGGYALARAFGQGQLESLFVGAVLTATSVSISAEVLRELGRMRTRVGATILGAAVIDDVLGVAVISVVLGLAGDGNPLRTIGQMVIFIPLAWIVANRITPLLRRVEHLAGGDETVLAILMGIILLMAWSSQALGQVAAITGAYILGVAVARHTDHEHVANRGIAALAYGFFTPIFFVNIGLVADARTLIQAPVFALLLLLLAALAKIIGCGVGALVGRFSRPEALQVGVGMMARGEVALVMVAAGRAAGLVDDVLFSATIVMTLITTLATPPALRLAFGRSEIPRCSRTPDGDRGGGIIRRQAAAR